MFRRLGLARIVSAQLALGAVALGGCARQDPPPTSPPVAPPVAGRHDAAGAGDAGPTGSPAIAPRSTDPQVVAGAQLYGKLCALCHAANATGYAGDNAPSLVSETFLATASDDFLRAGIGRGRPSTPMAGYAKTVGGPLDATQIDQIIAFLRNGAPAPRPLPADPVVGDLARGAAVYAEKCKECHGTPEARATAPHLANPVFLATVSDAFIRQAIAFGRPGTKMEAFAGALPESDLDAVTALVRSWATTDARPNVTQAAAVPDAKIVLNPKGKPPVFDIREDRFVSVEQVKKAVDAKRRMVIVDARPPSDWIRMHIVGAVSVPYYDLTGLDRLPTDGTWIIAYCACPHHESGIVVDELRKRGVTHSLVLDEGILVWQKLGYPVASADGSPVPPSKLPAPTIQKAPARGAPGAKGGRAAPPPNPPVQ